jgi:hypothetical protein
MNELLWEMRQLADRIDLYARFGTDEKAIAVKAIGELEAVLVQLREKLTDRQSPSEGET